MELTINEDLFKDLYPFIMDDNITDIKWNGRALWLNDLKKGRILSNVKLSDTFIEVFTTRIADLVNSNFNYSKPSLKAETDELRIHAIHHTRTADNKTILAIRKTPSVCRIHSDDIIKNHYADELTKELIEAGIRSHMSMFVIGDTGAGKTELEKYLCNFVPDDEPLMSVEDTLEMKLNVLYPNKDIFGVKVDNKYTAEDAINDALRTNILWLIIAEARGKNIIPVVTGASTSCVAMVSIHCDNVWEIPDRVVQMAGKDSPSDSIENDVHTFFDMAIKVSANYSKTGITRKIDQICFFNRTNKKNEITLFVNDGVLTGERLPEASYQIFKKYKETKLLNLLKEREEKEQYGKNN